MYYNKRTVYYNKRIVYYNKLIVYYNKLPILDGVSRTKNAMFICERFRTLVSNIHDNKTKIFPGLCFFNIVLNSATD